MDKQKVSEQIKAALDGRTQKWLHQKSGIPQSELSLVMKDRLKPSERFTERIKKTLGLDLIIE